MIKKLSILCNLDTLALSTEEKKKLMTLIEIAKEKILAFAQTICDISYQYICATKITNDYPSGIPICSDHIRERIIKSIHSRLNVEYSGNGLLSDPGKMILTSSQVYTMLSGLCINSDCHESFSENLRKCLFSFSDEQISDMVQSFNRNYREIVADLGMCAALALDAFGYLKFYVRYYHRVRPLAEDLSHDMMSERAVAVIHTLLQSGGSPEENLLLLKEKVREYIRHTFKYTGYAIVRDILTEIRQNSALASADISRFNNSRKAFSIELYIKEKEYQEYLEKLGSGNETTDELEPCFGYLVKRFKEIFKYLESEEPHLKIIPGFDENCMNMLINKYFERFDRLYYMLVFFIRVLRPFINKDELNHLKSLYCETITHNTKLYCSWESSDSETDARRAVSNYFNSSNPYKKKHTSIVLKKTFAFILEYYYKNRLAYSKDPTFDDEWIIDLTGGK